MTRLTVIAVTALLLGGSGAGAAAIPALDPAHLPALPAQGLIVQRHDDVLLIGLDGHVYGRLPGFQVYASSEHLGGQAFARLVGVQALQTADPRLAIVYDSAQRGWLLDPAAQRFRAVDRPEEELAGGAKLVIIVNADKSGGGATKVAVRRNGATLLTAFDLHVVGGHYVADDLDPTAKHGSLLDVVTGRRWQLPPHCRVAGVQGEPLLVCESADHATFKPGQILAGARRIGSFSSSLFVSSASVSPDGRWLLVNFSPGCGPGWAAVAPAGGGSSHFVTGERLAAGGRALPRVNFSYGLGWTTDSHAIASISGPSSCERESGIGTFLVDPATLSRTHVTHAQADLAWGT